MDVWGETDGDGSNKGRGVRAGDKARDGLRSCGVGDNVDPLTSALCADVSRIGVVLLSPKYTKSQRGGLVYGECFGYERFPMFTITTCPPLSIFW